MLQSETATYPQNFFEETEEELALCSALCIDRSALLLALAKATRAAGYDAGLQACRPSDFGWDDGWRTIVFIELPSRYGSPGLPVQTSWLVHDSDLELFSFLPVYSGTWDGHTMQEKYQRIKEAQFD
jgi:hypothetical protein